MLCQRFSPSFRGIWERVWVPRRTRDCKKGFPGISLGAMPSGPWTLLPKTPILLRRKEEKWLIGAPAHDKWVRFQLTLKILEFLPEGSGTGFLHKKRVPEIFPLPSSPRTPSGNPAFCAGLIGCRCVKGDGGIASPSMAPVAAGVPAGRFLK